MFHRALFGYFLFGGRAGPVPSGRLSVPEFEIDLDLEPEERFKHVYPHFAFALRDFVNFLHAKNSVINSIAEKISRRRGNEPEEMTREMGFWAKSIHVSIEEIHAVNMLYEFNTLMVPITNLTGRPHGHKSTELLNMIEVVLAVDEDESQNE